MIGLGKEHMSSENGSTLSSLWGYTTDTVEGGLETRRPGAVQVSTWSQLVTGFEGHLLSLPHYSLPVSRTAETSVSATPWHDQLPELQPEAQSSPQPELGAVRGYNSTQRLFPLRHWTGCVCVYCASHSCPPQFPVLRLGGS